MASEIKKNVYTGTVISDKMDKTIVVKTRVIYRHPQFGKVMRKTKKYKVCDRANEARVGDVIEFKEVPPVSKDKYMRLVSVVSAR